MNTWVSFQSAEQPLLGQFSVSGNRQAFITGQKSEKAQQKEDREQSRKDKKRIQELERELRRKDKALAETAALLVLRKSSTTTGGPTTRTIDVFAAAAVTR